MTDPIPACPHRWLIAPANGSESSVGVCQLCGETGVFKNAFNAEELADYMGNRNREKARRRREMEQEND